MEYHNVVTLESSTHRGVSRKYNASIPVGHTYGDWVPVQPIDPPEVEEGFHAERDGVLQDGDTYFTKWKIVANPVLE